MNWKKITAHSLIGIVGLPTIALGGSLTTSLVQGKTPEEAVQVLAEQIDTVLARLELVESRQVELEEAVTNVENTVASTSEAQKATEEALEGTSSEIDQLRTELEKEREKDAQEAFSQRCEDLKWAKGLGGKITIDKAYLDAVAKTTSDNLLSQLKNDYEYEVNDYIEDSPEYYPDYEDPERIAYCEADKTPKCQTTLRLVEAIAEETALYETERARLSDPDAKEYQEARALATRLKPQYDEYMVQCQ
jgi:vacuolar-type H+-ATPase subunit I/STV1